MKLFLARRSPSATASPPPTVEAIFRDELGFIVGALLHFGVALIDVEDTAHEVIRAVQRTLPAFDRSREVRPWLFGVAFNIASNHFRRAERHRARFVDDPPDVAIPDLTTTVEDRMIQDELHRTVRDVLQGIALDRRAVLVARVVHGMSELETAESLSIPIGTVKTRLRAAKQELRDGIQRREREASRAQSGASLLPLGALLASEGQIPAVPDEMRARLREQLQHLLVQPGAPGSPTSPTSHGGPAPGASPRAPLGARLLRVAGSEISRALVAAACGGALVFALGPINRTPATPTAPSITREDLAALCAVPSAASPSADAPLTTATTMPTTAPRASRTIAPAEIASTPAEAADPPASSTLIKAATLAYERHDIATARSSLEEHARTFPRSKFALTREVLWVRVLLSEGRRADAQAKVDALRKAAPQSPMVQALDALFPSAEPTP
ncbi:MAG: sigma-70 family RNA polymerase sigma factor [Byssovorax sp.]